MVLDSIPWLVQFLPVAPSFRLWYWLVLHTSGEEHSLYTTILLDTIVTKFLGRPGRGTGSRVVTLKNCGTNEVYLSGMINYYVERDPNSSGSRL